MGLDALLTIPTKIKLHIPQSSKHVDCFPVQTATTKIKRKIESVLGKLQFNE